MLLGTIAAVEHTVAGIVNEAAAVQVFTVIVLLTTTEPAILEANILTVYVPPVLNVIEGLVALALGLIVTPAAGIVDQVYVGVGEPEVVFVKFKATLLHNVPVGTEKSAVGVVQEVTFIVALDEDEVPFDAANETT